MTNQKPPPSVGLSALHKAPVRATVLTCTMLLVLSGCAIPGHIDPDAGSPLPDDFRGTTTSDNSAQAGVDEFFNDAVLSELISEGLASNLELKIRNQEVEIAANEILSRRGAYLPFVTAGGRGSYDRTSRFTPMGAAEDQLTFPGGGTFPDPIANVLLSGDLFWRIDIWRELRNSRDAAIQRYCKAVESRNFYITGLVAEIAENYYELAALDKRLVFLNLNIELQERSLGVAERLKANARGTELAVQRFLAEVRKNESQRLIVAQSIIETENRINFLVGRYPQPVARTPWDFISLDSQILNVGVPAELLENRRDILAAEHEVAASGLDVLVARARFFPRVNILGRVGYEAFNPRYLFDPGAFIAGTAGELIAPVINKKALQADYMSANARQLQAVYEYQRTILNAFTEVVNSMTKVANYRSSVAFKQQQVTALESSVDIGYQLFGSPIGEEFARVDYIDVLLATRDLLDARTALVETKQQQLSAIVDTYRALGGGFLMSKSDREFDGVIAPPAEIPPEPLLPEQLAPPLPADPLPPETEEN